MEQLGPYKIEREIGQGSLAVVYEGLDPHLKRSVAIKVLHPIFSKNKKNTDRLKQEALTLAQLDHPNIIHIYSFLEDQNIKGIVTEYVPGKTLSDFLKEHAPLLPQIACRILCDLLSALEHAHSKKIIHRDIKPENIMISQDGQIKLADFGIAKILDEKSLTLTGQLVGSPYYLSPEQASGKPIDDRSDIFSLGILFYYMLTGKLPFYDTDPSALIKKILTDDIVKPSQANPALSEKLDKIASRALCKNKEQRFQKAWEFRYEILRYLKEMNLGAEDIDLKSFFKDPNRYQEKLLERLLETYLQKGKTALEQNDFIAATNCWNTILHHRPHDETVLALLNNQSRQDQKKKFIIGGIMVLGILFSLSVWWLFQKPISSPENTPSPSVSETNPETQDAALLSTETTSGISWSYLTIKKDSDTQFFLNGKEMKINSKKPFSLRPGKYKIRFKKPGFRDIESTLELKAGETSVINISKGS